MASFSPEEILEKIGGCGRFQIWLSIITHCMKLPVVPTMNLMLFSIATQGWWCLDKSDNLNTTSSTSSDKYSQGSNASQFRTILF